MPTGIRPTILLLAVAVLTAGSSILYLSHVAHTANTRIAHEYPAPETNVASDFGTLTRNVVDHGVFSLATTAPYTPDSWRTPGYIWFTAPLYALSHSFYPILLAQVFVLFLTVVLIFWMARRIVGEVWAFGLSVLYLILPDTLLSASALLNENLFMLAFVGALYVFFFVDFKSMYVRWAITGFLFALTAYIKPASLYILLFFIPAYFLFYLPWREISKKHVLAALLMCFAFAATLFPWCIRNHLVLGTWSFASTGAYELFRQNATQFYEAYHHIPNLDARYALEDMAGIPRGAVPLDPKYSPVLQKVALAVIFEHPVSYAIFHATTFIPFFTSSGVNDYINFVRPMLPDFNPVPEPSLIQALHPFSIPVLLVVLKNHGWTLLENTAWALLTVLVFMGLWRSKDVRLMRMFFALVIYFAAVTGPIAHARYRIPVEPLLLIAGASTLVWLKEHGTRKFFQRSAATSS